MVPELRRSMEIAENLDRAELTTLERDEHVAEWIRLADAVSTQVVSKPQGGRPEGGTRAAARELGVNRDDARRATKIAALSDEARVVARAASKSAGAGASDHAKGGYTRVRITFAPSKFLKEKSL
jgi:hypothetical protein